MKILITGSAGFIGSHVASRLTEMGFEVVGIDSINDYYDVQLKYDRLKVLGGIITTEISDSTFTVSEKNGNYKFIKINTNEKDKIDELFKNEKFDLVCHLAAQPGVRYSLENPYAYIDSNINGFITILEGCRHNKVGKLVYASSSSVYGDSNDVPFIEKSNEVNNPVSLYAATKRSNELMAYTYSHLYKLNTIGLRLFTVYGPWGRPDMAPFIFSSAILEGNPIKVFNNGDMYRDFTYIDDIVEGITLTLLNDNDQGNGDYNIYNIGNHVPVSLNDFINIVETACDKTAIIEYLPMQPGDVHKTYADVSALSDAVGFAPNTSLKDGMEKFIKWYMNYYMSKKKLSWKLNS